MITILKVYLMTHLSIDYIDDFNLGASFMYNCSNPIDYPNPRQLTMGLTYATCVTKGSLVSIVVILFCSKDMMLLNLF